MEIIQYILLALIAIFYLRVIRAYFRRKLHEADLILWTIFWAIPVIIVLKPNLTQIIADKIGIGRGVDLVIYISIMILYYAVYQLLIMHRELDEKITLLGRSIALNTAKDNTSKETDKKN